MRRGWKNSKLPEKLKRSRLTICRIECYELRFARYERTMRND